MIVLTWYVCLVIICTVVMGNMSVDSTPCTTTPLPGVSSATLTPLPGVSAGTLTPLPGVSAGNLTPLPGVAVPLDLNCQARNLTALPLHLFNASIQQLDLSRNMIKVLKSFCFRGLVNLAKLDISQCGIIQMSVLAFDGLFKLRELDIKNNPVIGSGLSHGMLQNLSDLRTLSMSGYVPSLSNVSLLGELRYLEEVVFTPGSRSVTFGLETLPNISRIYFAFCKFGSLLTPTMINSLTKAHIKELAFMTCGIQHIANNTFDGFTELKVLNMFGQEMMSVDHVIDVLSTSDDISVSTLILDLVGAHNNVMLLGQHDHLQCRQAWTHVEKLTLRGTNTIALFEHFTHCLPNLRAVAYGFNTVYKCGMSAHAVCPRIMLELLKNIEYVDFSYYGMSANIWGLKARFGWHKNDNNIMRNDQFIPSLLEVQRNSSQNTKNVFDGQTKKLCIQITVPPYSTYLKADHVFKNIIKKNNHCLQFSANRIEYINVSNRYVATNNLLSFTKPVYGLYNLKIFDASDFQLSALSWNFFQDSLLLQKLFLDGNSLGMRELSPFPSFPELEILDLSRNHITKFQRNIFAKLVSLRYLNLAHNELRALDILLPDTLDVLILNGNQLTSLDYVARKRLYNPPQLTLHIESNPLQCGCLDVDFVQWFQTTPTHIKKKNDITCARGTDIYYMTNINTSHLKLRCGLTVNKVVISSVGCGLVLTMMIIILIIYRYRWSIKWRYYKLRYERHHHNVDDMLMGTPGQGATYSAYVVYPSDDDFAMSWVTNTLLPRVEQDLQKPQMFIKGRDDIAGQTLVDEVVRGIMQSQTAIWIICPSFFGDKYCELATNLALHQLGAANNLLLIIENRFERYSVPRHFASLMRPDIGVSRITYTDSVEGRELFWAKLDSFLPAWNT